MKKLRIYISSNAPWAMSGYSQQMAELIPHITSEGYPLACGDFFGLQGGKILLDNVLHYPTINHVYGSDGLIHHANDFKADVVFTLQDIWVLNQEDLKKVKRFCPIVPIDHDPVPKVIINNLRYAYKIITYSQFGRDKLKELGFYSTYIPHTVNTEIFKPMDKAERKKLANLPQDCFLVGMVSANKDNPPRKSFQEVMDAFVMFLKKEPKALLYIHTNPEFPGGFPIHRYAEFLGIRDKVIFPDAYQMNFNTSKEKMALIYNTFDVLLCPSRSEGFGVPIIEAQSCGIPVIVNNWTSMPELIIPNETGFLTDIIIKVFTGMESYMAVPSPQSIYECLIKVYNADRKKMGERAREYIVKNYHTDTVFKEKWVPFFQQLETEVYPLEKQEKNT